MLLLLLSLLSLAAAVCFALLAWYVVREDRQRSSARVAALASTALDDQATTVVVPGAEDGGRSFIVRNSSAGVGGHPLVKVAVGAAMTVALIVFIAMNGDHTEPRQGRSAAAASASQDTPLELVSMRHERDGDSLAVTGLVKNAGAAGTKDLTAVVFAFDRAGNFIASGRAPLDFARLAPGDESPFRVTIPHASDVGRYRVSFRTDAGLVRHVDRRASLDAAAR